MDQDRGCTDHVHTTRCLGIEPHSLFPVGPGNPERSVYDSLNLLPMATLPVDILNRKDGIGSAKGPAKSLANCKELPYK